MKLYEINEQIQDLTDSIVDPETGEIAADADAIIEKINTLNMERSDILGYLAKTVLNLRGEQELIESEITRLSKRRFDLKERETGIMAVLDRECGGTKTDLGVATISYRKGEQLTVSDKNVAMDWLCANGHGDLLRYPPPEIGKDAIKKLIKSGVAVPGCEITATNNCSLK